jgi:serine/threonine protein kinase
MAVYAESRQVTPTALDPGTQVDGWRILKQVGQGRFGVFYRVEPVSRPGAFFTLEMEWEWSGEGVEQELDLLMKRAVHPHVVRVHAHGCWPRPSPGNRYFVRDEVQAVPLHTWAGMRIASLRGAIDKLATMALTLEHLHAEGVFHRALRPEHLLVRVPDGKPLLTGFGLGWSGGMDRIAPHGEAQREVQPRSPEAVAFWRKHYSKSEARYAYAPTDDVYALGVSAYRVLTGQWPFPSDVPQQELLATIERLEPPAPRQVNRRIPRAISDVIQRMMAKRVRDRFPSCAEAHAALVAAQSVAGSEALEVSVFGRSEPRSPRPRARVTKETAVLLGFTALVGVTVIAPAVKAVRGPSVKIQVESPAECSRIALANMRRFKVTGFLLRPLEHASHDGSRVIEVRDNEKAIWTMLNSWGSHVPEGTRFHGSIWVRDRLYGRFERMVFPDGREYPVCLEFWKSELGSEPAGQGSAPRLVPGIPLEESSPESGVGRVDIQNIEADPVRHWGRLR